MSEPVRSGQHFGFRLRAPDWSLASGRAMQHVSILLTSQVDQRPFLLPRLSLQLYHDLLLRYFKVLVGCLLNKFLKMLHTVTSSPRSRNNVTKNSHNLFWYYAKYEKDWTKFTLPMFGGCDFFILCAAYVWRQLEYTKSTTLCKWKKIWRIIESYKTVRRCTFVSYLMMSQV